VGQQSRKFFTVAYCTVTIHCCDKANSTVLGFSAEAVCVRTGGHDELIASCLARLWTDKPTLATGAFLNLMNDKIQMSCLRATYTREISRGLIQTLRTQSAGFRSARLKGYIYK